MVNPFVLADRDRLQLFSALGRSRRLFDRARTWVDDKGTAWIGTEAGTVGVGLTWLGPGWVFDDQARADRASDYAERVGRMAQATVDTHETELRRIVARLRLGPHAERLLWALHVAVLASGRS